MPPPALATRSVETQEGHLEEGSRKKRKRTRQLGRGSGVGRGGEEAAIYGSKLHGGIG